MKELTLDAIVENIPIVTEFVEELLKEINCPLNIQYQIDIAIDELFGNIANYAYGHGVGPATVRVEVLKEPLAVAITFMDKGIPYNPLSAQAPDITLSAEERPIGGLGIHIVKKSMDDISYEYKNGRNLLTIKKNII